MRRYSVTEAPRDHLLDAIADHIIRDEHLNPEKTGRIEAYQRAHAALSDGADEAWARHFLFRVADTQPRTYHLYEGTKADVMAELAQYRKSREDAGNELKAARYARAQMYVQFDNKEVQVENVVYRVIEG